MNPDKLSGQALSDAVAERVMGWKRGNANWFDANGKILVMGISQWQPHLDMNQCMEVLNRFTQASISFSQLVQDEEFKCRCLIMNNFEGWGKTPHEAILRACLKAVIK